MTSTSDEVRADLSVLHEPWLSLGMVLANSLDESVRAQLGVVTGTEDHGIDKLTHEFREAPSIDTATVAEIRSAAAVSEFCAAVEGLMLQDEDGPRQVVFRPGGSILAGDNTVPGEYLVERIADAISCKVVVASQLFHALVALLQKQMLQLPDFHITVSEDVVYIDLVVSSG